MYRALPTKSPPQFPSTPQELSLTDLTASVEIDSLMALGAGTRQNLAGGFALLTWGEISSWTLAICDCSQV